MAGPGDKLSTETALDRSALATLNSRSREIFRRIVDSYLATGDPVVSRQLSRILPMTQPADAELNSFFRANPKLPSGFATALWGQFFRLIVEHLGLATNARNQPPTT